MSELENITRLEVEVDADIDDFIEKIEKATEQVRELKRALNSLEGVAIEVEIASDVETEEPR